MNDNVKIFMNYDDMGITLATIFSWYHSRYIMCIYAGFEGLKSVEMLQLMDFSERFKTLNGIY